MAAILNHEACKDDLVVSLANAVTAANRCAREAGVDFADSLIAVSQCISGGQPVWRVNYGPRDYQLRRGGDLVVDVDPVANSVLRVLRGQ